MKKKQINAWTIYLWRNGKNMEGAAPIKTRDGIKEVFCYGWKIEPDPKAKRNEEKHQVWSAKTKLKNLLNDTLNVVNWYGRDILDRKGNIDPEKLKVKEMASAYQAIKEKVGIDDLYKIKKFPVKEITLKKAIEYKFK